MNTRQFEYWFGLVAKYSNHFEEKARQADMEIGCNDIRGKAKFPCQMRGSRDQEYTQDPVHFKNRRKMANKLVTFESALKILRMVRAEKCPVADMSKIMRVSKTKIYEILKKERSDPLYLQELKVRDERKA